MTGESTTTPEPAPPTEAPPGPTNSLTDVAGIRVGHTTRRGDGWLTGVTVVLAPDGGAVGGVDVRGGGPGTRETDLLDPRNLVDRVHAVTLAGGSAYGLAAADGVMAWLEARRIGFAVGSGEVVPIVPAAVLFDLGRSGQVGRRPGPADGTAACDAATTGPVQQGSCGAGTGAVAGGLKGGVGSASAVLASGVTVAALVAVNAAGACFDGRTGRLDALRYGRAGEFPELGAPSLHELAAARRLASAGGGDRPVLATTLGVIATDATLTKAQCAKVAGIGHDGLARGIRPVHTMVDGDTVFTLATGARPAPDPGQLHALLHEAGDCVTRAIGHALLAATTVRTPSGELPCYRDVFPSAF